MSGNQTYQFVHWINQGTLRLTAVNTEYLSHYPGLNKVGNQLPALPPSVLKNALDTAVSGLSGVEVREYNYSNGPGSYQATQFEMNGVTSSQAPAVVESVLEQLL